MLTSLIRNLTALVILATVPVGPSGNFSALVGQESKPGALPDSPNRVDDQESAPKSAGKENDQQGDSATSDEQPENLGQEDLNKAFELKITVATTRDLDRVADLCESAIEKGLDADSRKQAEELWASVLSDHAKQLEQRIAPGGIPSTRWRWLRSQAISRLQKSIELRPERIESLILLAELHSLDSGDREVAVDAIEKAIAQIKDDNEKLSKALYIRARLAEDDESLIADLTQAVKINPQNFEALLRRGMFFLEAEKTEDAMADFNRVLDLDQKDIDRHVVISGELRRRSLFKESVSILDRAIDAEPENDELLVLRGQSHLGSEDSDLAINDLNRALEINRLNADALNLRARVYVTQEEFEKALDDANELIQQQPDNPMGLGLRSLIYRSLRKLDEAIKDVEALLDKDRGNLDYKFDLAILLNANEEPSRAIPYFNEILRSVPEIIQTDILRSRADAYLSLGKHEQALEDYELALELFAETKEFEESSELSERDIEVKSGLLNNLAWVLATSPKDELRDGERAIKLAIEASELTDYKAAFILSTLASGYAETGDFETARKWAAQAVEFAESDEQRVGLQDELDSYIKNEPWRELENVEEEKKKKAAENGAAPDAAGNKDDDTPDKTPAADDSDRDGKSKENDQPEGESDSGDESEKMDKDG